MPWHELLAFLGFTAAISGFCWFVFFPHRTSVATIDNLWSILKLYAPRRRGAKR